MLTVLLLACSSKPADPAPVPSAPSAEDARENTPTDPIPTGDGADYSGKWLVILSSRTELGHMPDGAKSLLAEPPPVESRLARLSSTQFKDLQPCFEIVVAQAFADRKAAVAYSKQLTKLGVDNYPKNAGKWVGEQPRVDAYCAGERAELETRCPNDVALAETHAGRHFLRVPLDPAITEPVLSTAPPVKRLTDGAWVVPVPAKTLGGHALGDAWNGYGPGHAEVDCTVARFVVAVRGTPHFGWYDEGDQEEPGCGSPEVMAELSCAAASELRWASKGKTPTAERSDTGEGAPEADAARKLVEATSGWQRFEKRALSDAGDRPVAVAWEYANWATGSTELVGVRTTWTTGEGFAECGGEDVNVASWALVDSTTKAVVFGPMDAYLYTDVVPVDLAGDGSWEVWTTDWLGSADLQGSGGVLCTSTLDYCDCAC